MHHKRRRPKNRRAGCLLCKPHKGNGMKGRQAYRTVADLRSVESMKRQLLDTESDGTRS
jgi:hypothetical protein